MFNLSVLISQISSFVYIYITIWWFHSYLSFSLNIHSLSCVLLPLIRQWPQYYSNCDLPYATTTPSRISTYISHLHWLLNCNSLHLNPTTYEAIIITLAYCFYSRPLRHRSHPLLQCIRQLLFSPRCNLLYCSVHLIHLHRWICPAAVVVDCERRVVFQGGVHRQRRQWETKASVQEMFVTIAPVLPQ